MRHINLTGREVSVVKAIGFCEPIFGAEIQEKTRMEPADVTDTLNGLLFAGFAESVPAYHEVPLAAMPVTSFEINPAYAHELRNALLRGC